MYNPSKFITLFSAVGLVAITGPIALSQARLSNQSKVLVNGIGSIRVGMTVSQASQAAGTRLVSLNGAAINNRGCFYVKPLSGLNGVELMLTDGRIARVDIVRNSSVTTASGAKIGDTEARIKSLYRGQIEVSPHKYTPGWHYLTFIPKNASERNYRLVFETNGNRVVQFRSGRVPEVESVERCG